MPDPVLLSDFRNNFRPCRLPVPAPSAVPELGEVPSPLDIHIEQYEGPLDLLLDLIRKQQINIYDIPIASITSQYLEYMQRAIAMDIELSSEFVYMAATLIHIKSKMLLPRDPALGEDAEQADDPREHLLSSKRQGPLGQAHPPAPAAAPR